MIRHPELNRHIHKMVALAPITSKHNLKSPFRFVAPIIQPLAVTKLLFLKLFLKLNLNLYLFSIFWTDLRGKPSLTVTTCLGNFRLISANELSIKHPFVATYSSLSLGPIPITLIWYI